MQFSTPYIRYPNHHRCNTHENVRTPFATVLMISPHPYECGSLCCGCAPTTRWPMAFQPHPSPPKPTQAHTSPPKHTHKQAKAYTQCPFSPQYRHTQAQCSFCIPPQHVFHLHSSSFCMPFVIILILLLTILLLFTIFNHSRRVILLITLTFLILIFILIV